MDCRSPRCRHLDDGLVNFEHHDRCRIGQLFDTTNTKKEVISVRAVVSHKRKPGPAA